MKLLYILIFCIFIFYIINNIPNKTINNNKQIKFIAKKLIRQAARWSTAAKQDNNSMIAVLHANYGAGYLWALKDIINYNIIEKNTGINMMKFENEIIKIQDTATQNMAKLCPKYAPESSYLTNLAGEG